MLTSAAADTLQIQSLLMHLTGRRTVPNVLFDFDTVGGSDELTLLHAEGGLQRRFEDMELLPGARRRRTPIHPPHVGPAQPAARQDAPADKGNAKVKPRVVQPVEPVAPVPVAPAAPVVPAPQAKPEVKKAQDEDVVVPKDVGYDQPVVDAKPTEERLGFDMPIEPEPMARPELDDKVKVNDNGIGKHKAKAGVKAGAPGAIPKGASPGEVRAAIQAAHGTDYLDEAIREQYNIEWDDISAPLPNDMSPLPNDMGPEDTEEFPETEYAEEYYDDESAFDEDAEALLLEMDDQLQIPMGGKVGKEQVAAFDSVVGSEDIANAPKKASEDMAGKPMADNQPEKPAVAAAKAKPVDPAQPPAKPVEKAPAPAKPLENAPPANKAPVPADKGQAKDAAAKKVDTPKKPAGAKAKAKAKIAERKAAVLAGMKKTADGNGLAGGKKDTVPAKEGKQDEIKRKAGAVPAAAAAPVQAKDNVNGNGRVADAKRVAKPVEEKAQVQDKARAEDPATEQERDTELEQPKDRSDASDQQSDMRAKDRLSKDPKERAAQIDAQAKAMGARKMADRAMAKKAPNGAKAKAGARAKAKAGAKAKKGKVAGAGAGAAAAKAKKGVAAGAGVKDVPAKKAAVAGGRKRGAVVGKVGGAVAAKKRLNANANKQKLAERKAAVVQGKKKAKILK